MERLAVLIIGLGSLSLLSFYDEFATSPDRPEVARPDAVEPPAAPPAPAPRRDRSFAELAGEVAALERSVFPPRPARFPEDEPALARLEAIVEGLPEEAWPEVEVLVWRTHPDSAAASLLVLSLHGRIDDPAIRELLERLAACAAPRVAFHASPAARPLPGSREVVRCGRAVSRSLRLAP